MDTILYILNGDSVAGLLQASTIAGGCLVWRKALYQGPLLPLPESKFRRPRPVLGQ